MTDLHFTLLGSLTATRNGQPVDLGTRKQRALLALLLVDAGRVVSVDRLVDDLWGGDPPGNASASLQAYISHLRRALEPARAAGAASSVLLTEPPGYRLNLDAAHIDARELTRLASEVRQQLAADDPVSARATADAALASWQGTPLAEFSHEPWAQTEVARLHEIRLTVIEDRLRAVLDLGDAATAVVDLEALVEEHPYREGLWALLMLALYRTGRTADALARYQRIRDLLGEELGLDPGPELREMELAILRQDDQLRWVPDLEPVVDPQIDAEPDRSGLVGRVEERAILSRITGAMAAPDAPWLVLEGEAGIGKTRLAEVLAAEAEAAGVTVAWGRCHEDRDSPGFWPWLQVLHELGIETTPHGAREGDRFERSHEVVKQLTRQAEERPILVVIDDVQWADPDSLRLLAFAAVELRGARVAVAATLRTGHDSPELAEALATISRRPQLVRLTVPPLAPDEVGALAALIGIDTVDDAESARLHDRTAGNPFLIGELVRLPASARAEGLPGGARDVLVRRLATLPEESRAVVTLAAVIGRQFDVRLLARAAAADVDRLADLLDLALARRILLPGERVSELRFAHDLLRETVLAEAGDLRQRRLHARVAEALEELPARDAAQQTELARHLLDALPLVSADRAIDAAMVAASRATDALAFDEAAHWHAAALTALDADSTVDPDGSRRQRLLLDSAGALGRAGRVFPWRSQVVAALRMAISRGDIDAAVEGVAALVSGGAAWLWSLSYEDPTEVLALLEEVRATLTPDDAGRRSRLTAAIAQGVYYRDGVARAGELADEAVELARRAGDQAAIAGALVNVAQCRWGVDGIDSQLEATADYLALPEAQRTIEQTLACHAIRATVRLVQADLSAADLEHAAFVELGERHGRRGVLAQLAWYPATRATLVGDFAAWDDLEAEAFRLQQSVEVFAVDLIRAGAWVMRYHATGELDTVPSAILGVLAAYPFGASAVFPALIHARHGRVDEARSLLATIRDLPHRFRDWAWLANMVQWAELVAAVGDDDAVTEGLDALRPYTEQVGISGTAIGTAGPVAYGVALLEQRRGDLAAAQRSVERGRDVAERMGASWWAHRADTVLTAGGALPRSTD